MKNILFLSFAFLIIVSCKSNQKTFKSLSKEFNTTDSDSIFITIERTPCMGVCPWYNATIYENGLVVYDGKRNVTNIGMYITQLTPEQLIALKRKAEAINYFKLNDKYNNESVTDLPGTTTSVQLNGKRKTILNRFAGPNELNEFEKSIDALFDTVDMKKMRQPIDKMER